MNEVHKIIVPIDFLEHTDQIIEYAGYIAKKFAAGLDLIHAVEPAQTYAGYAYPALGSLDEEKAELAEKMMKDLVDKNSNIIAAGHGKVLRGDIVDSIIDYTEDQKGDLIIIGTHGRKGWTKMWLGSVAEQIIKKAPCPTLTCNPYKPAS